MITVRFYNQTPKGALHLVSDQPVIPEGIKSSRSDVSVTERFVEHHLNRSTTTPLNRVPFTLVDTFQVLQSKKLNIHALVFSAVRFGEVLRD